MIKFEKYTHCPFCNLALLVSPSHYINSEYITCEDIFDRSGCYKFGMVFYQFLYPNDQHLEFYFDNALALYIFSDGRWAIWKGKTAFNDYYSKMSLIAKGYDDTFDMFDIENMNLKAIENTVKMWELYS